MNPVWQTLVGNFAGVALIISVWMHISYRFYRLTPFQHRLCFGLVLGLATTASMMFSVEFQHGIYFDLRIALIEVAALFGGPVALAVTAAMAAVMRIAMGGIGLTQGLSGITVASLSGLALWWMVGRRKDHGIGTIFFFSGFVGLLSLFVLIFLPKGALQTALPTLGLPIACLNMIVAAVCGFVIVNANRFALERDILRAALGQAPDYYYVKNLEHRFVATNLNVARYHGRERSSEMVGLSDVELEGRDRAAELIALERQILVTGEPMSSLEEHVHAKSGDMRWFSTSKVPLRNRHGDIIGLAGVTLDITERKMIQQELQDSRDIVTQATAEMSDGMAFFNPEGILLFSNQQYRDLFPRSGHLRVPGSHIFDIVRASVRSGERLDADVYISDDQIRAMADSLHQDKEEMFQLFDGRWIRLRTRQAANGSSLIVVSDVTAAREAELGLRQFAERMKGLAETDGMTGLANRRTFDEHLAQEFKATATTGKPLALLMIDVDRFKAFNDTYGHLEGDGCLKRVGECLRACARREADLAARYGGEEFALILPDTSAEAALARADEIGDMVRSLGIEHKASEYGTVTISIGVAVLDGTAPVATPTQFISLADVALYRSKEAGRDRATLAEFATAAGADQRRSA